jgi:hypothetical protein
VSTRHLVGSFSGLSLVLLTAFANSVSDPAARLAAPTISLVAPVLTSGSRSVVRSRQPIIRATLLPSGTAIDTTKTILSWRGSPGWPGTTGA